MELIFNLETKTIILPLGLELSLKAAFNAIHAIDPDNADQWFITYEDDFYELDEDFFSETENQCSNENCICKRQTTPQTYVVSTTLIP